jgi:hypothetical protein
VNQQDFFTVLSRAGMPEVPRDFSVAPHPHLIPSAVITEVDAFLQLFERITTSVRWQDLVTASAPPIARTPRSEVCFFTAWDFHLSPEHGWQLIECNDNGSGFFYAGLINRHFYELAGLEQDPLIEPPASLPMFTGKLLEFVEQERRAVPDPAAHGLFAILESGDAARSGKFFHEFLLLRDLFRGQGWQAEIVSPEELGWDGQVLSWHQRKVVFVVNRSTDFFWQAEAFSALRTAYLANQVYVAPNPFTYATRSDKGLLEYLSLPDWDRQLGIRAKERAVLNAHVPPTYRLREENLAEIAQRKDEFFFKPLHGFAGHGILTSSQVGLGRLRRLLRKKEAYVAQQRIPKPMLSGSKTAPVTPLWTDLRVWAYRGQRFLISGRASRQPDILDLTPPGGWLPTYVCNPCRPQEHQSP